MQQQREKIERRKAAKQGDDGMRQESIKNKAVPVTLRLSREQHGKLAAKAKSLGVSLNSMIAIAADMGLTLMEGKITIHLEK